MLIRMLALFTIGVLLSAAAVADVSELLDEAKACLRKADFKGAASAYEAAAKQSGDDDYKADARLIHRVIALRERLAGLGADDTWVPLATGLRTYYFDNQIYSEALPLDRRLYAHAATAESAVTLARTHLALGQDAEVRKLLAQLPEEATSAHTRVLAALVHARQGNRDAAREVLPTLPKSASVDEFIDRARVYALLGDTAEMAKMIRRGLEATPPLRIANMRGNIRHCAEFTRLHDTAVFTKALATESKIKASDCSSGTSCGKCPNRSKCGSGETSAKTDDAGGKDGK